MTPQFRNLRKIEIEVRFLVEKCETFGIGLHETVFDSIVNHLHKVTGAGWPHVGPSMIGGGGESFENRTEAIDGSLRAADHQTVSCRKSPDAAAGSGIDELNSALGERRSAPHRILVVGIAAVD